MRVRLVAPVRERLVSLLFGIGIAVYFTVGGIGSARQLFGEPRPSALVGLFGLFVTIGFFAFALLGVALAAYSVLVAVKDQPDMHRPA